MMKAFLTSCAVILAISFGASFILNASYQKTASQSFTTTGVRL
ncbi:MAG: hypothetical protein O9306_01035 [Beijerinckiaceae bacterium]|jgi:hypothetical protein|nr:hypothetical protein [Beijerinckiaceae bacterium]